jgi:hypothetical protein
MTTVTCNVSVSVDNYVAGPNQSVDNPVGPIDELHLQIAPVVLGERLFTGVSGLRMRQVQVTGPPAAANVK